MKCTIDTDAKTLTCDGGHVSDLFCKESFDILARLWTDVGWVRKYSYAFTWMGRPIIQLPEDMVRTQEVIWETRPDVIVETGIAHGGSLIFYASLFAAMGRGRVIGIDVEIRKHNLEAIRAHPMYERITLVEGDSAGADIVRQVKELIRPDERVMVILDFEPSEEPRAARAGCLCGPGDSGVLPSGPGWDHGARSRYASHGR